MKKSILIVSIILLSFVFTGCEIDGLFGPSKKELELKQRELDIKELELKQQLLLQNKKADAQIALEATTFKETQQLKEKEINASIAQKKAELESKMAQEKAELDGKKEIELAKIKSEFEKEKLEIEKQKIKAKTQEKDVELNLLSKEKDNQLEFQKYIILFGIVIILILAAGTFVYFNNRRKDKLRAYEDNLDKYFREKENQAKVDIANRILDTISQGRLNAEQENKLILAMTGANSDESSKTLISAKKEDLTKSLDEKKRNTEEKKRSEKTHNIDINKDNKKSTEIKNEEVIIEND